MAASARVAVAVLAAVGGLGLAQAPMGSYTAARSAVRLERLPIPGASTSAYVARIDHRLATLALYPGTDQPPVAVARGPASVPNGQRWRLLATFNGGFKYTSVGAENGFAVDGHTYVWLKRGLGTLIEYRDGRVDVRTWRDGPSPPANVVFARQNLPLIVDHGQPVPQLSSGLAWGATLGGVPAVWRTGVGIDRNGDVVYAAAASLTARALASILIRAGAVRAIELDINPEWPTFNIYAHSHGLRPWMFVPNPQQTPSRYLSRDSRDSLPFTAEREPT